VKIYSPLMDNGFSRKAKAFLREDNRFSRRVKRFLRGDN